MVIFFDGGVSDPDPHTYFVDNIRWRRSSYNGCVDDHETTNTTISNWKYFANGHIEATGYPFAILDNPNPSGINTSSKVGEFIKAGDGDPWAGMFADLDAPIDFKGNKTMRAKVHMNHIGNFALKLENSAIGEPNIEVPVPNTKTNEWEEITVEFPTATDDAQYRRLTLFFDLLINATGEDVTSYFDDIVIGDGECLTVSAFERPQVEYFRIAPNPASSFVRIENAEMVENLVVLDATGRPVQQLRTYGEQDVEVDIANLPPGMYILVGYNPNGALVANGKFVKN
ncbi:MAG: T9SS type A sorting domain-containing protein [Saprospirales bacterium]|nr:T9SS type A sorting domain-containing protein [Saprospirales bacterium]